MPQKTAPQLLHEAQDLRVGPVWNMTVTLVCQQEPLLATVKRQLLAWFGHFIGYDSFKAVLHGHDRGRSTSTP
ncbi:hypothetical protein DPMN_043530 [Dreissena polymorpha]|uniref:Uncharacterized protein n=1 Tax=Dreissena polymorpha TaxID=45954 RepID=A0A9D4D2Y8_DREPO|nr:hypothetical protein DPMN_043530 [Dreissena polymorpha]